MQMHMMTRAATIALTRGVVLVALAGTVSAAQSKTPVTTRADERLVGQRLEDSVGAFLPLRHRVGGPVIYGLVENHRGELVANAGTVHIRSLVDGAVVAKADVNELAQFTVRDFKAGVYVAELVDRASKVIVTTAAFDAQDGEIIRLVPVIPVRPLTGFAQVLRNTTTNVVSSAASMGVLAVSPGTPVSPQ